MDAKAKAPVNRTSATKLPLRPDDEAARLGEGFYERDIRHQVEPEHDGEIVAIDLDSGHWAIGDGITAALDRLREEHPDAHDTWCVRVGYRAVYSFGGGHPRRTD